MTRVGRARSRHVRPRSVEPRSAEPARPAATGTWHQISRKYVWVQLISTGVLRRSSSPATVLVLTLACDQTWAWIPGGILTGILVLDHRRSCPGRRARSATSCARTTSCSAAASCGSASSRCPTGACSSSTSPTDRSTAGSASPSSSSSPRRPSTGRHDPGTRAGRPPRQLRDHLVAVAESTPDGPVNDRFRPRIRSDRRIDRRPALCPWLRGRPLAAQRRRVAPAASADPAAARRSVPARHRRHRDRESARSSGLHLPAWLDPDIDVGRRRRGVRGSGDPIDFIIANNLYLVAVLVVLGVLLVLIGHLLPVVAVPHVPHHRATRSRCAAASCSAPSAARPLDRVQGVNLTRPMVARLLGMAKLEVVGAGTDSNVKLEYLSTANAEAVRADILRLASGRRLAEAAARAGARRRRVVTRRSALGQTRQRGDHRAHRGRRGSRSPCRSRSCTSRSAGSSHPTSQHRRPSPGSRDRSRRSSSGSIAGTSWLLFGLVPALIGFGAYWVRSIMRSLRYSIAPTPTACASPSGCSRRSPRSFRRAASTPSRSTSRSCGGRPAGGRSRINRLSGRELDRRATTTSSRPCCRSAPRADVERVLRLLLPSCPRASGRSSFEQGMLGPKRRTPSPTRRAALVCCARCRGGATASASPPDVLLLRRGAIWRKLAVFPLARLQSIGMHQGPLDRLLRSRRRARTRSRVRCRARLGIHRSGCRARPLRRRRGRGGHGRLERPQPSVGGRARPERWPRRGSAISEAMHPPEPRIAEPTHMRSRHPRSVPEPAPVTGPEERP